MTQVECSNAYLRPHRHRHRPRRLCLCHPRRAARPEDRGGGEARHFRRHLPEHRLHSVEGALACLRIVRGSRPQIREDGHQCRRAEARSGRDDEIQGRRRRRQRQGRRLPPEEEQGRCLSRNRAHRRARQGRGEGRRRQDPDFGNKEHRDRHRLRRGAAEWRGDRRKAHRIVRHRDRARQGAGAPSGDRRRRDRA